MNCSNLGIIIIIIIIIIRLKCDLNVKQLKATMS